MISERGVMDRTLAEFTDAGEEFLDDVIIKRGIYMEEVKQPKPKGRPKKEVKEETKED